MRYQYKHLNLEMPSRAETLEAMPSQPAREVLERLGAEGLETYLDRFEAQQPLCRFGLDGTCCRRCQWGPCRVTTHKRGICGASLPLVVAGNHLRMVAAGCAAHGQHARQRMEALLALGEGRMDGAPRGPDRARWLAGRYGLEVEGKSPPRLAAELAEVMLDDLGRVRRETVRTLLALAPPERIERWRQLDVLPTSAFSEVFDALQRTTLGADSDWRSLLRQELRVVLAFFYSCVVPASLCSEILYGRPEPRPATVGYGALSRPGTVKVALHGHTPVLAEAVVAAAEREDVRAAARAAGATDIELFGICCTGQELLARHGIPSTSGILGQEMVIGTGALDAVVVDLQCVIPGIMPIARCFGTEVITTCDGGRLEGATHIPFAFERAEEVAVAILHAAIAAYARRDHAVARVPEVTRSVQAGYDADSILAAFGGRNRLLHQLREGAIRGIATMVSCNTPKLPYERNNVVLAQELLRRGVLVTTTGCAAHALFHAGLASPDAADAASPGLAAACREAGTPPVLPVGACVDNTRTMLLFIELAREAGADLPQMPFFYVGAEPGNEKALGMGMSFLAHGIPALAGQPAPVPPLGAAPGPEPPPGGEVANFFAYEVQEMLGARLYVATDPLKAAEIVVGSLDERRAKLGWKEIGE